MKFTPSSGFSTLACRVDAELYWGGMYCSRICTRSPDPIYLLQIVFALRGASGLAGLLDRWEQQRNQHSDHNQRPRAPGLW